LATANLCTHEVITEEFTEDVPITGVDLEPLYAVVASSSSGAMQSQKAGDVKSPTYPLRRAPPERTNIPPAIRPRTRKPSVGSPLTTHNVEEYNKTLLSQGKFCNHADDNPVILAGSDVAGKKATHLRPSFVPKVIPRVFNVGDIGDPTLDMSGYQVAKTESSTCPKAHQMNAVSSKSEASRAVNLPSLYFQPRHDIAVGHCVPVSVSTISSSSRPVRAHHSAVSDCSVQAALGGDTAQSEVSESEKRHRPAEDSQFTMMASDENHEKYIDSSLTTVSSLRGSFTASS